MPDSRYYAVVELDDQASKEVAKSLLKEAERDLDSSSESLRCLSVYFLHTDLCNDGVWEFAFRHQLEATVRAVEDHLERIKSLDMDLIRDMRIPDSPYTLADTAHAVKTHTERAHAALNDALDKEDPDDA